MCKKTTKLDKLFKSARLYRKRPVAVWAVKTEETFVIKTLEGIMTASPGDYIIEGVNGERYPCKPDIFEKIYEHVKRSNLDFVRPTDEACLERLGRKP